MELLHFLCLVLAILVSLSVHEAAHALAAYYLGDPTAKLQGRTSLNPVKHLDLVGSMVFLVTGMIGWGKPVPVNAANFKYPVRDSALVALAGPMANFALALPMALIWKYLGSGLNDYVLILVQYIFDVSIFLGVFNLFPFPPLDGSKILGLFLPRSLHAWYANYLANGVQYFVAVIVIDVLILGDLLGRSFFVSAVRFLHDWVSAILLLGT